MHTAPESADVVHVAPLLAPPRAACCTHADTCLSSPAAQVGCAGHKLTDVEHGQEDWLEVAAVRFGYGRVTVDSGYSLLFELVGDCED